MARIHSQGRGSCEYKKGYSARKQALASAKHLARKLGEEMNAYKCEECHTWHVGHAERYRAREARYVAADRRREILAIAITKGR